MLDVAEIAGVSAMTVSRALRNPSVVAPETLRRIQVAIKETGYIPNRVAGNLSSSTTNIFGMIVPSLRNSLFAETIQGVVDILGHDFDLMIANSGYSLKGEEDAVVAFLSQRVCGIILHNTEHTARTRHLIRQSGIPCVETGNLAKQPLDMVVGFSNRDAGRAMTEFLNDKGFNRIGFVSLILKDNDRAAERKAGYMEALGRRGIPVVPDLMLEAEPGLKSGGEAFRRLYEMPNRPDAIFLSGDVLAIGAVLEANRNSIRVPEDIAIAGSDDNELHENILPSLTSIRFPRYEIGRSAANMLVNRVLGKSSGTAVLDLGFEIVERDTTK